MEYRFINYKDYKVYQDKANIFLEEISLFFGLPMENITSHHVIKYFENRYNIIFVFLDVDPYEEYFRDLGGRLASKEDLRYKGLVKNYRVQFVIKEVCDSLSGMTATSDNSERYVIYINQNAILGRVMFSILHELSHVYAHLDGNSEVKLYASMKSNVSYMSSGNYPKELQPYEDEANTLASLFLLNDKRLEKAILERKTFNDLIYENRMSGTAILNRLKNFLIYGYGISTKEALRTVLDYRRGHGDSIYTIVESVEALDK